MNIVVHFKDKKNSSGCIRGDSIILYISSRLSREEQQRHIDYLTDKLLKRRRVCEDYVPSGVNTDELLYKLACEINDKFYRFPLAGVSFKKQYSRYGSCSLRTRKIYISHRMINAPEDLLEYLLIHELCHLKEPNHGKKFWELVAVACPDYKARRKKLRNYKG